MVTQLTGSWNFAGYINLDELVPYEPVPEHLVEYTNTVLPLVLERLGWE